MGIMVPVVDMSGYASPGGRAAIARQVARAAQDIGFFTITGHGVPAALIEDMRAVSKAFFGLPAAQKATAHRRHPDHNRGFFPYGEVALAKSTGHATPPDRKEVFSMGLQRPPEDVDPSNPDAAIHFAPNYWPEGFPRMQEVWARYFDELLALADRLMRVFALALDLPEDFFVKRIDHSPSSLAAVDYFETSHAAQEQQLRAGAHTDYGTLTILLSENKPGGLQVRTRAGEWIDVLTVPDAFVINIGDLMQRWTNDKWLSNLHRVANPPADASGNSRRLSIVFFHNANFDALIECIPSCLDDGTAKYPPILAGEHRLEKFRRANRVS
ncbi:2-oxoglutarate and iron-dependent oxygenase domain-containing protein [Verticiella sediminum]